MEPVGRRLPGGGRRPPSPWRWSWSVGSCSTRAPTRHPRCRARRWRRRPRRLPQQGAWGEPGDGAADEHAACSPPLPGTFVTARDERRGGHRPLQTYSVRGGRPRRGRPGRVRRLRRRHSPIPAAGSPTGRLAAAVDAGAGTRIVLATPGTVDSMCPAAHEGIYSCGQGGTAVPQPRSLEQRHRHSDRADRGVPPLRGEPRYGHVLGHGHASCPGAGQLDPVMAQQTKGLTAAPNGWPYPDRAARLPTGRSSDESTPDGRWPMKGAMPAAPIQ